MPQKVVDGWAYATISLPVKYRETMTPELVATNVELAINSRANGVIALEYGTFEPVEGEAPKGLIVTGTGVQPELASELIAIAEAHLAQVENPTVETN